MLNKKQFKECIRKKAETSGIASLKEKEATIFLLTFVVNKNTDIENLAESLLEKFGSFQAIMEASCVELMEIGNLSQTSAQALSLIRQINEYLRFCKAKKTKCLNSTKELVAFFKSFMACKKNEEFYAVALSKHNEIKALKRIAVGKPNQVEIQKKDVSDFCINSGVKKVAICHNHPKATCEPSRLDDTCTTHTFKWLNALGIELIDHIIVGVDGCFSFKEVKIYK